MIPSSFRYPLIAVIIVSVSMYILTYPLHKSAKYLEGIGAAYAISWLLFIPLSIVFVRMNDDDK